MKNIIRKAIYITEKTIIVVIITMALGLINNGNLSLLVFRKVLLFSVLLGLVIGLTIPLFDIDKLNTKIAYLLHFIVGYSALNILEGLVFNGTVLPNSPPLNYLYKLIVFILAYVIVAIANYIKEKRNAEKMSIKIEEIKESSN